MKTVFYRSTKDNKQDKFESNDLIREIDGEIFHLAASFEDEQEIKLFPGFEIVIVVEETTTIQNLFPSKTLTADFSKGTLQGRISINGKIQ